MSIADVETYRKLYPDQFPQLTLETVIFILLYSALILSLPFLIPYIYIKFFESSVVSLIRRAKETIKGNAAIGRLINLIDRVLKIQIFNPKIKI